MASLQWPFLFGIHPFRLHRQPLKPTEPARSFLWRLARLLVPGKHNQRSGTGNVSLQRLLHEHVGKFLRVPSHPPVCRPTQPFSGVLWRRTFSLRRFTFLSFTLLVGCSSCYRSRCIRLQLPPYFSHLSAISGHRSTCLHTRKYGIPRSRFGIATNNALSVWFLNASKNAVDLPRARAPRRWPYQNKEGTLHPSAHLSFRYLFQAYRKPA